MPEWIMLPESLEPKLAVLLVLIGVILGLSYFGRKDEPRVKTGVRQVGRGK